MVFSYSQLSMYSGCPRRYRHRYLDGWQEKSQRASMFFGRVFEQALAAHFSGHFVLEAWEELWAAYRREPLEYGSGETWEKFDGQGRQLLEMFIADRRVVIDGVANMQAKFMRRIGSNDHFVAYVDAIGTLDGVETLIDWKTSSSAYPVSPAGLVTLDAQLVAYSWMTGISRVALVVFVRKKNPEIQYLVGEISDTQRLEYARMVEATVASIRQARFEPRSGIRFPQDGCLSCGYLGLCLGAADLVDGRLERNPNLVWIDQLCA
jgi:hypothetical protein